MIESEQLAFYFLDYVFQVIDFGSMFSTCKLI